MKQLAIATAYGLVGWALCGAVMGIARAVTTPARALVIHAVAAPLLIAAVSMVYFKSAHPFPPLKTAAIFTATVILADVLVVAMILLRSFEMFASPLGTWIPFGLMFLSTWTTGLLVARK